MSNSSVDDSKDLKDLDGHPETLQPIVAYAPTLDQSSATIVYDNQGGTFAEVRRQKGPATQLTSPFWILFASGAAFVSDGYQNSLLTTGNLVYAKIYGKAYSSDVATRVSNALLVGTILGQFTVGFITDGMGRKAATIGTTVLVVLGGLLGTVAFAPTPAGLFWFLTVARGVVGLGAGGEYPATGASTSEAANQINAKKRGWYFIMSKQICNTSGSILTICVFLFGLGVSQYDNSTSPSQVKKLGIIWRCEWAVGVLLPLIVFIFRMRMLDSNLYRKHKIKARDFPVRLFVKRYWRRMVGVGGSWFIAQFVGTASSTFSSLVIKSVLPESTTKTSAEWQLFLGALAIPATIAAAFAVDRMPRKWQFGIGFGGYVVFGIIIGACYTKLQKYPALFFVLYALFQQVATFGPGATNGVLLAETYPTAVRGTMYGATSAFGKLGAVCGTYAFLPIKENLGTAWVFYMGAILGAVAIVIVCVFFEDKRNEPFSVEDEAFAAYLRENGYTGPIGDATITGDEREKDEEGGVNARRL